MKVTTPAKRGRKPSIHAGLLPEFDVDMIAVWIAPEIRRPSTSGDQPLAIVPPLPPIPDDVLHPQRYAVPNKVTGDPSTLWERRDHQVETAPSHMIHPRRPTVDGRHRMPRGPAVPHDTTCGLPRPGRHCPEVRCRCHRPCAYAARTSSRGGWSGWPHGHSRMRKLPHAPIRAPGCSDGARRT
jgi:hypothetical protein